MSEFDEVKEKMSDLLYSLRRTLVPLIVGFLLAQAARAGFDIPAEELAGVLEAVITGIYYTVVRVFETKFPNIGLMLGGSKEPVYTDTKKK